jgi:hypothetical protein
VPAPNVRPNSAQRLRRGVGIRRGSGFR